MISRKPLDLPPAVARAIVKDMAAYFIEADPMKRDEIALRQLHALKEFQGPREKALRLSDVKAMFEQMMGFPQTSSASSILIGKIRIGTPEAGAGANRKTSA